MSDKKEEKKEKKPLSLIQKVQRVVACVFALWLLLTLIRLSNASSIVTPGASNDLQGQLPPVEAAQTGPQFDIWMNANEQGVKEHTTSKGYYTGVLKGTVWTLTFKGDIPGSYIDNMFSWDMHSGEGRWKAEQHVKGKLGERADGTTKVSSNPDGTFHLVLLDKSGQEYGTGTIVPQ